VSLNFLIMIEVRNLTKSFDDKTVLKGINATFETGKTNLIIGQSGSGKTVLVKNIVGLLKPTKGDVLYDGRNFVTMTKREQVKMRREMGMIFQNSALFDSLSVLENVQFPLDMFSNMNYRDRVRRARECLDRVNLTDAQRKYPGEISGGMQKRVAIARAVVMNPKYLFCDEPNSGLDPKTSLVIDNLLSSITKDFNITTIINTHDMNSVMGIGENIIFIYKGRKEWQGTKDEVMTSTNKRLNDLVFASDLFQKVKEAELDDDEEEDSKHITRNGWGTQNGLHGL
jgi:phospholipid/cholesterol/gamma-HCH transport system ATP-binding protein